MYTASAVPEDELALTDRPFALPLPVAVADNVSPVALLLPSVAVEVILAPRAAALTRLAE